jgi:hypothetical protein
MGLIAKLFIPSQLCTAMSQNFTHLEGLRHLNPASIFIAVLVN